jgi:glycosyltransferase involved in cell wall biosynthesis
MISDEQALEALGGKFDPVYYTSRYPDIDPRLVGPLEHYHCFGWREGRDPCNWFSTKRYLARNVDVAQAKVDPFAHYILYGAAEGRPVWPAGHRGPIEIEHDTRSEMVTEPALRALIRHAPHPLSPVHASPFRPDRMNIHWVIPDFSIGSGGHMTIFRMIWWLELAGHKCTVWIADPAQHASAADACDEILKHFQPIRADVRFADSSISTITGDAIFATGWQTVPLVCSLPDFRARFYFVQDLECHFHPFGSHSVAASWTYTQDLACICAGPWLAQVLNDRFGRWTKYFYLAYDQEIYTARPLQRRGGGAVPRIAVYARMASARRAVELAFLALEHLAANGVRFHVDLFGDDLTNTRAPFPCTVHGILDAPSLAALYHEVDLGICFSTTNYSLAPQEMMACGLPVVEIDGESTRSVFPDKVVTFAPPHPREMANAIQRLLRSPKRRRGQAEAALAWVQQFSWEAAAKLVETAVAERISLSLPKGRNRSPVPGKRPEPRAPAVRNAKPKATICIPVYNGGSLLCSVVARLLSQRTPWTFQILLIDSSSTDGAIASLPRREQGDGSRSCCSLEIIGIDKAAFQHGRTRNMGVDAAAGEFVAFLTQDALPTDDFWLYRLISMLERYPNAAGVFGRHLPWPSASPFTKRDINAHFDDLLAHPLALSRHTDLPRWERKEKGWLQTLHYYSDNNSCLRKSVWREIPYPELEYGEDQAWAFEVIKAGYDKVFAPFASVFHSHEYTPSEATARAEAEAFFFAHHFGYQLYDAPRSFADQLADLEKQERWWAYENHIDDAVLAARLIECRAQLYGRGRGLDCARALRLHKGGAMLGVAEKRSA